MVNDIKTETPPPRSWLARRVLAAGTLLVVLGLGLLYGMSGSGKQASGACGSSAATVTRLDPLIGGEVAALNLAKPAQPVPVLAFEGDGHVAKTLADFKGTPILLNLWATWCVPCRKEMPALDRLQDELGGPDFQVVAINVDTAKLDRPKQFLRDVGATHLPFYADPTGNVLQAAKESGPVLGLPTTFLIDRNGCTVATLAGAADWASEDAKKVIAAMRS